jgi:hypothetical protein
MLPVEAAPRSLQPYPDDPAQDSVVNSMVVFGNVYNKITSAIGLPFEIIGKAYEGISKLTCSDVSAVPLLVRPTLPAEAGRPSYAKRQKMSYDNKFDYLISGGKLWFRPLCYPHGKWKELGPNGNPSNQPLVSVSADGDNLIVIDDLERLWYAKTTGIEVVVSFDCPKWRVVKEEITWIRQFYTFPIVSFFSNKMNDSTLYVNGLKNIFVTHKGVETLFYTDMSGKKIVDSILGTSMIWAQSQDGTRQFIADPYIKQGLKMEIVGPENGRFVADNATGSGNTVMQIQRGRRSDGSTFNHCYTRFIEPDELLTVYPHTYDPNNRTPMVRFFPPENWIKQPSIPMRDKIRLTNHIGMMQTGCGQSQRILFWEGMLYDGKTTGFYAKFIYDPAWRFIPTHHEINPDDFLCQEGFRQGPKIAFDYSSDFSSEIVKSIRLNQFISLNKTERAPNTTIEMILHNHQRYTLRLHQLKGLKYVFGLSDTDDHWTLIAPRERSNAPEVRQAQQWLMGDAVSISVNVEEAEGRVRIFVPDRFNFEFTLEQEQEGGLLSSLLKPD